ncbi:MAG: methyl-accepting chemotaxis protein [Cocleimonas sp.]|nr:methyl-accepting chemotaxis protein [Cocleimonas sp.]
MLNKFSINTRMLSLIALPALLLLLIGYLSFTIITADTAALKRSDTDFKSVIAAADVTETVNKQYTQLLSNINSGFIFWKAGEKRTTKGLNAIQESFDSFNSTLSATEKESTPVQELFGQQERLIASYTEVSKLFLKEEDKKALNAYVLEKMFPFANALTSNINKIKQAKYVTTTASSTEAISTSEAMVEKTKIYVFGGILAIMILGNLIMLSITRPAKKLTKVVHRLSEGEFDARAEIKGTDEFAELGSAFNNLLDDRALSVEKTEKEHQELNQSVFQLLQAVAELSERNLTVRAEVTEDATGPVADAINLLAEETSATLLQVRDVAAEVNETSKKVNTHLMSVNKLAMREQEQAIETAEQMDSMLLRLDEIANSAAETNTMADNAVASTNKAHESVTETLTGMSEIRDTVQETGKRIKHLGERSQEISHVIDIINTIAERTTVLALNASMQAAAAGDAGRGFSVIAEEIQRLSESSRESTGQIATLVRNIQQETNTAISTMDKTIEQVIDGSTRAEDAALQMKEVLVTTSQLVESVDQIASASREQVGISETLKHKAQSILKSTQSTGQELLSLTGLSRNMSDYAQQLVHSVNVFNLGNTNEEDNNAAEPKVEAEA